MLETKDATIAAKVLKSFCSVLTFKANVLLASSVSRSAAILFWSVSLGSTAAETYD
ncbi:hypothetical protein DPMN_135101 [Dreissena polymorpha]|uniref:Uncharacterized protein n=1 Tax=Dreissena polymorpha TaxID=45954 RepID=A0A9D4G0A5_DREPO|nr:hypothetical protein DPMN_135101 [Dreissena polymorpha]